MTDTTKRDNSYWIGRLQKDGHGDLLAQVKSGKITVYKATQKAGYRKTGPRSPAATLSYHWGRADHDDRKRFVMAHLKDVNRVLREVGDDIKKMKAQKPSE
ncbi:hypothetical protein N6L26_03020 [Qipengyuania sp. SS22]|uniref:hypothetical protein n=1 Tax=Qipengyuania sp. SS22 TaxID=2979461 RepID=UPI0021E5820C|nr:hypothetical protein [Qipengyuania sp. SS22]UYH55553.1 hypothetical protein N6L26_03020 [Qipengyuania sp. SS22]